MLPLTDRPAYSYRNNASIPPFDDSGPIAFMDGDCALCSRTARLIVRLDRRQEFKICPTRTEIGQAVLYHYGLDPGDTESWLYLAEGRAYGSMDAVIRVGARLGGLGWALQGLRALPRSLQDWLYRRIARNRYSLFGRTDICALPDPQLRSRLME
ncbi:thiol-disulfide oxidoreductase DCC family protein [Algihabitans sp.]|uniref:thiol-disulfide oxidoreductase DCC family protein n=1 Tax=Algihabitans sp. TaxID=2821514 RepID=UPI003BA86706